VWHGFLPTSAVDPTNEVLAAQLLEIVGSASWGVGCRGGAAEALDLTRHVGRGAAGRGGQGEHGGCGPLHARFVEVHAGDLRLANLRGQRQRVEHLAPDEIAIDERQRFDEAFEDGFQFDDEVRKLRQCGGGPERGCYGR
jgi:hypothetical protein